MSIYLPEEDRIYFPKTKEYFKEVANSYSVGNYRSAVVMLYSITICDMLFKLQELKDIYNDSIAIEILQNVEKNKATSNSKSSWEKDFIEEVYNKTEILDIEAFTNLRHLYEHRNLSAHPVLNDNYELITPSRETTFSHIKNILTNILCKPPIFAKNIVETLSEDINEKKVIFKGNTNDYKAYLDTKYFNKMTNNMKLKVFKSFWKFCFNLPDDDKCKENINANRTALGVLFKGSNDEFKKMLTDIKEDLNVSNKSSCCEQLIILLSNYPELYKFLNDTIYIQLDKKIDESDSMKLICWFKFESFDKHLAYLYENIEDIPAKPVGLASHIVRHYEQAGMKSKILEYLIYCFGKSRNYSYANWNYDNTIKPYLEDFTKEHFIQLISAINENDQLYNRNLAKTDNTEIYAHCVDKLGKDFDFSQYKHFIFNVEENTSKEDIPL